MHGRRLTGHTEPPDKRGSSVMSASLDSRPYRRECARVYEVQGRSHSVRPVHHPAQPDRRFRAACELPFAHWRSHRLGRLCAPVGMSADPPAPLRTREGRPPVSVAGRGPRRAGVNTAGSCGAEAGRSPAPGRVRRVRLPFPRLFAANVVTDCAIAR